MGHVRAGNHSLDNTSDHMFDYFDYMLNVLHDVNKNELLIVLTASMHVLTMLMHSFAMLMLC